MVRKFGKNYEISNNFEDYLYMILGVAGVGKTTLAIEIGRKITGNTEGTFVITCGREPLPSHISGAFGDHAKSYKDFTDIITELCENVDEYPHTKFVCWDSLDELFRITEAHVVNEYNKMLKVEYDSMPPSPTKKKPKYIKTIAQAYGGYQKGESKVADLIIDQFGRLVDAGYKPFLIGHTKIKSKTDLLSGITYEQIGCNLSVCFLP